MDRDEAWPQANKHKWALYAEVASVALNRAKRKIDCTATGLPSVIFLGVLICQLSAKPSRAANLA
jgi:hypothetical protein